jgi:CHAD domain-containing protein
MAIAPERGKRIFRKAERDLLRLTSGQESETVHSFRTTTHRLQTLLEQIVPVGGRHQKKLLKMLNRIRKAAGGVRDIDAQLTALRSLKTAQEPRRKTQLTQKLIDLRAEHEKQLRKLLREEDIRNARKRLKRVAESVRYRSAKDPLIVAREILEEVRFPDGPPDEELLHRYRIAVKRARYAVEFASDSREATQSLAHLKRLQDALGHWHDWLTLTHTAIERIGNVNQSSLVAALYNVTRGKFRNAVATISAEQAESNRKTVVMQSPAKSRVSKPIRLERTSAAA